MAKLYLLRGRNYILTPLPLIDKAFKRIVYSDNPEKLEKYKKIATNWIRRTVWDELKIRNNKPYEEKVIPLTLKEFNWLKEKYDSPI